MNVLYSSKGLYRYLTAVLALVILSACSNQPHISKEDITKRNVPVLFSELNNNSVFFLDKADKSTETESLQWQLFALQALIAEKQSLMANSVIEHLQYQPLTPSQRSGFEVLKAANLYQHNLPVDALATLNSTESDHLSETGYLYFLKLKIGLEIHNKEPLNASNSLLLLAPLIESDEDKQYYNDLLFTQLLKLPSELLNPEQESISAPIEEDLPTAQNIDIIEYLNATDAAVQASIKEKDKDSLKNGWYQLASLYQRYQLRPNQLVRLIEDWQTQYPTHPAFNFIPTQSTVFSELNPYQPENVAVLIPLSGRFKQQGEAIKSGLLHAYYDQLAIATNSFLPTKLHFFDTQALNLNKIVEKFTEKNIDFVIGPLLKNKVEEFLPLAQKMPVLALNSFPKPQTLKKKQETVKEKVPSIEIATSEARISAKETAPETTEQTAVPWHYAFPLSPEEEAKQAADFIYAQGHQKPLLIAPDSDYGNRIARVFNQQWDDINYNNSSPVESYFYNKNNKLSEFIEGALQTDKSKRRIDQMKLITRLPLKTKQRSRRDIDAIYIVSKRDELLMLKAFIDVSISPFAPTIPLYASSRSHIKDSHNKDLNKLTFSDSPFLLDSNDYMFDDIQENWGTQSLSKLRLFALGFDSYNLIERLVILQNNEENIYEGLVGELSLNTSNMIEAKLNWAKYKKGKLIEITTPVSAE